MSYVRMNEESYVRMNEDDSDLYMFASGQAFELIVNYEVAQRLEVPPCHTIWLNVGEIEARQEALEHIKFLMDAGVRIPDRPIERLLMEIRKREEREIIWEQN